MLNIGCGVGDISAKYRVWGVGDISAKYRVWGRGYQC